MERPSEFRSSHKGPLTPYRYGDRKWEDYLLDTQTFIHDGAQIQVRAVESLGRQMAEQESNQAIQLQGFIAEAGVAWDRVSCQLDTLTDQLATGFHWPAPFHETECSATVCRSLQITGRTGACGCRVSPAGKTEAGSAGEQPAKGYPAETHSDESPGRASGSSRRICAWSGTSEEISRCLGKLMLAGSQAAASLLRSCRCSNSTGDR